MSDRAARGKALTHGSTSNWVLKIGQSANNSNEIKPVDDKLYKEYNGVVLGTREEDMPVGWIISLSSFLDKDNKKVELIKNFKDFISDNDYPVRDIFDLIIKLDGYVQNAEKSFPIILDSSGVNKVEDIKRRMIKYLIDKIQVKTVDIRVGTAMEKHLSNVRYPHEGESMSPITINNKEIVNSEGVVNWTELKNNMTMSLDTRAENEADSRIKQAQRQGNKIKNDINVKIPDNVNVFDDVETFLTVFSDDKGNFNEAAFDTFLKYMLSVDEEEKPNLKKLQDYLGAVDTETTDNLLKLLYHIHNAEHEVKNPNAEVKGDKASKYLNCMARLYATLVGRYGGSEEAARAPEIISGFVNSYHLDEAASDDLVDTALESVRSLILLQSQLGEANPDFDAKTISKKIQALQALTRVTEKTLIAKSGKFNLSLDSIEKAVIVGEKSGVLATKVTIPPRINQMHALQNQDSSKPVTVMNFSMYTELTYAYDTVLNRILVISSDTSLANAIAELNSEEAAKQLALYKKLHTIYEGIQALSMYQLVADIQTSELDELWRNTSVFSKNFPDSPVAQVIEFPQVYTDKGLNSWYEVYMYAKSLDFDKQVRESDASSVKDNPFYKFINKTNKGLQEHLVQGISASALYEPMKQKINEVTAFTDIDDTIFWKEFLLRYGNHRKAVLLDTTDQAPHNVTTTEKVGNLRVATLRDLMNYPDEVVLVTDPGYYNLDLFVKDNPEVQFMYEDIANDDAKNTGTIGSRIAQNAQRSFDRMVSNVVPDVIEQAGAYVTSFLSIVGDVLTNRKSKMDKALLTADEIEDVLNVTRYTPALGYTITSAVFRDQDFARFIDSNNSGANRIIFMSSATLNMRKDQTTGDHAYINYLQLKAAKANLQIDAEATSDMDKPLYVDIFGNIVTESGYVVVPAASNATLVKNWTPYTVAFLTLFNNVEYNKQTEFLIKEFGDTFEVKSAEEMGFKKNTGKQYIVLRNRVENGIIDVSNLSTRNSQTRARLLKLMRSVIIHEGFENAKYFANIFCEVFRGAPLNKINKKKENIQTQADFLGFSKKQAWKFEQFRTKLYEGKSNSIISTPNLLSMDKLAIPLAIILKLTFLASLILILVVIFMTGVQGKFSLKILLRLIMVMVLSIVFTVGMPFVYTTSMYEMNRLTLQEPILRTALLSLAKEQGGREVNLMGQSTAYEAKSQISIKLESLSPNLVKFTKELINLPIDEGIDEMLKDMLQQKTSQRVPIFETRADGVYVSLNDLVNASTVRMQKSIQTLRQYKIGDTSASFYTPYYTFIDVLLDRANAYSNSEEGKLRYNNKIYKGSVKTTGFLADYYLSDKFAEDSDIFMLKKLYNSADAKYYELSSAAAAYVVVEDKYALTGTPYENIDRIKMSQWYNDNATEKGVEQKIEKLDQYVKKLVSDNRSLLNKVDDETFIRFIALCSALKYNALFNIPNASTLDVQYLSNDELIRFCIAPVTDVEQHMTSSFAAFVYALGNDLSVYLAAFLEALLYINGWLKYLFSILLFCMYYFTLFIRGTILGEWNTKRTDSERFANLKFAVTLMGIVVLINVAYAAALWTSFKVPNIGAGIATSIIYLILIQFGLLTIMSGVMYKMVAGWRDLGYASFQATYRNTMNKITSGIKGTMDKLSSLMDKDKDNVGVKELNKLQERQKRKRELEQGTGDGI